MDDELCHDESLTGQDQFKVETFVRILDEVNQQLNSCFSDDTVSFMSQLRLFTPAGLMCSTSSKVKADDVKDVCETYNFDTLAVCEELEQFRETYRMCSRQTIQKSGTKYCLVTLLPISHLII